MLDHTPLGIGGRVVDDPVAPGVREVLQDGGVAVDAAGGYDALSHDAPPLRWVVVRPGCGVGRTLPGCLLPFC